MAWTLYFDGGCNLCHESQIRAVRWARKRGVELSARPLQSEEAISKGYAAEMVVENECGVFRAAAAWRQLMTLAPWYLVWVGWLGKVPPIARIMDWGYGVVARNRLRWFGTRSCPLPNQRKV